MKKKTITLLFALLTAGSVLLSSGCGVDLTSINEEDTTLSTEMEEEDLSDGTIQIHSVWYNTDESRLTSATVTISDESGEIFSAVTDDSGKAETCTLPANTVLTFELTDAAGTVIASSQVVFKLSSDYTDLTIYTVSEDTESERVIEIPPDQTDIRAAIFVTEDAQLSFANLTPWSDSYDTEATTEETTEETSGETIEGETTDTTTEGEAADTTAEGESADTAAEGETTETGETAAE